MTLTGTNVALVGGAGFIGHSLALELAKLGASVHAVDSLQVNNLGSLAHCSGYPADLYTWFLEERLEALKQARVPLHVVDARNGSELSARLAQIEPDAIVHLAAISSAERVNRNPALAFDHGLGTLKNTLEYAREAKCHVVYLSSSMVYGDFKSHTVTEEEVCEPIGLYGAQKLAGEKLVIAYRQAFGVPYTIVRPSALYGERCVSRRVTQVFVENALMGKPVTMKGDGEDALDFTYIADVVQGLSLVVERAEARDQIFNLTYGSARTLHQALELLRESFPDVTAVREPRDGWLPKRGTLSVEKARRLLGYEPQFPFERGFPCYVDWYKSLDYFRDLLKHSGRFKVAGFHD